MPSLFVIQGADQGKRFDLTTPALDVGRGQESAIRLQDTEVSRRHAQLEHDQESNSYCLRDLQSSNGTFVNNDRVSQHLLRSGDRIQVGRTLMIYTGQEDASLADLALTVDIVSPQATG